MIQENKSSGTGLHPSRPREPAHQGAGRRIPSRSYVAGFFDGEGCVRIATQRHSGYEYFNIIVEFANTNLDPLNFLMNKYGGSIYTEFNSRNKRKNQKPCYKVKFYCQQAMKILKEIKPYITTRKKQVALAFEFEQARKRVLKCGRPGRSPETTEYLRSFVIRMKKLNKRGLKEVSNESD